ncbi:MAG: UDP-3-O-acyl-N-acetylglucosamine deacetylase [Myxococcaceae bacterium]|nr:UDP-3-O-acyl-N-acetylglucosamine deacetylase [Myxococcaceae bacterium]
MAGDAFSQRTLRRPVGFSGVGLHSGTLTNVTLVPAPENHGVVFVRKAGERSVRIPARSAFVVDTSLATTLGHDGVRVGTVEHLLAALAGLGLDNVRIDIDGPEVPILDGSSAPIVERILEAGFRQLSAPKRFVVVKKAVSVTEGDKSASLAPSKRLRIDCTIDFKHPLIADQHYSIEFSDRTFVQELARARTFGFLKDVERLRQAGLAKGGSLDNAIVVDEFSILNPEGLRFPDEFVRHKLLDTVGDLSLLGMPMLAHMSSVKSGHALNHALVRRVLSDPSAFEVVSARASDVERLELEQEDLAGVLAPAGG